MGHVYEVQTNQGTHQVESPHHHDHISKAEFERSLLNAVLNTASGVATGLILRHYTYKGRR